MKSKIHVDIDTELLNILKKYSGSDLDSIVQDALAQFLGIKQVWVKTNTLEPISDIDALIPKIVPVKKAIDTFEPFEPVNTDTYEPVKKATDTDTSPISKRRRRPKFVLKIWETLKTQLGIEFTINEYWDATKKCHLGYKDSARNSTILDHLRLLEEAGKIVTIGKRPKTFRKLDNSSEQEKIDSKSQIDSSEQEKIDSKSQIDSSEQEKIDSKSQIDSSEQEKIDSKSQIDSSEQEKIDSKSQIDSSEPEDELHKILDYGKKIQNKERVVNKNVLL